MATVTIKFQNSLNWYIWFTSTSYQCWLNPLKTQAIFIILAVLVIKRVQRVLTKLHPKRAIIRTLTVTYGTLQKNKRSSVLNLPEQRQVMRISVIYGTLSVSCKRVVSVLSPLASNSCGGSQIITKNNTQGWWIVHIDQIWRMWAIYRRLPWYIGLEMRLIDGILAGKGGCMSNIPSINLVSRCGRLPTPTTGRKRLFMRGFAVSVKSF